MRIALALALALVCASSALADDYVVLAGFDAKDPFQRVASAISKHHGNAPIVAFDPADPDRVLPRLRELQPRFVAIVLRPEQIDVNSVRRILVMSSRLDDDPFVDFEFGYLTGATVRDADAFVANIVRASKLERPRRIGYGAVWGVKTSSAADEVETLGELTFRKRRLAFAGDRKSGRDQAFLDRELKTLAGCGAIEMGGHGMPWEIGHGPQAADIARVDLFPAVVVNYACHTGAALRWLDETFEGGSYVSRFAEIGAEKSFALSVLRAGATAYVAYVNPRPAGPETSIDFDRILCGATLGESRRRDYDKVVLGYLGFGEKGLAPPVVKDGGKKPAGEVDAVRDMMLDGAAGGILYGDPAMRAWPETPAALPQKVTSTFRDGRLRVSVRVAASRTFAWCSDPFRREGEGMAQKVVDRVPLPEGFGEPREVRIISATWGRTALATLPPLFAVEEDGGKRWLHVKVNWPYTQQATGEVSVELEVTGATASK